MSHRHFAIYNVRDASCRYETNQMYVARMPKRWMARTVAGVLRGLIGNRYLIVERDDRQMMKRDGVLSYRPLNA